MAPIPSPWMDRPAYKAFMLLGFAITITYPINATTLLKMRTVVINQPNHSSATTKLLFDLPGLFPQIRATGLNITALTPRSRRIKLTLLEMFVMLVCSCLAINVWPGLTKLFVPVINPVPALRKKDWKNFEAVDQSGKRLEGQGIDDC